jgi:hypothetical protein
MRLGVNAIIGRSQSGFNFCRQKWELGLLEIAVAGEPVSQLLETMVEKWPIGHFSTILRVS